MQLYQMQVAKTQIYRTSPAKIPRGIIGAAVELSFSPEWENLKKTVIFRAGEITKDIVGVDNTAVIPAECTEKAGVLLEIGVYGVDAENTVAIPTLWAAIGRVTEAADPSGDETTDPALPVYAQLLDMVKQLEEQGATKEEVALALEMVTQLEEQGVTQHEIDLALRDFFGGERPVGRTTPQGGEIFNDYRKNKAQAPYAKADGYGNRAGIYGYKLLAVEKNGDSYNITVRDAALDSKAEDNYAAGDLLCFDGQGHFYDCLRITAITTNGDGNSVITVSPTDDRDLSLLVVDSSKDEWENWVYVLEKPEAGEPVLAARGSYAGGVGNVAVGYGAFAHGAENRSIGKCAYTAGRGNVAYYAGYAKGRKNKALGEDSSAEGIGNTVTGASAHADGMNNIVSGKCAHAQNGRNVASGSYASASGVDCKAAGSASDAGGAGTEASGAYSFTRGYHTEAGDLAAAFGRETNATGYASFASGRGTIAAGKYQHVHGKYNVEDTEEKYAEIVGGGSSDTIRKNIYTMDWDGNAEFAGKVYSGGVELAQTGLVYSAIRIASGTDEDLMAKIDGIYAQMADNTVRYISVGFGEKHPTLGGASYLVTIYRCTNIYGYLEAGTYVDQRFKRSFNNGVWGAWENHSKSAFAPSGFGLGTVNPPVVSDLNTCLCNGWYYTGEQTSNLPNIVFRYAAVHVTARTSQQIVQRLVSVGHPQKCEMLRYTEDAGATWVEEWVNPPLLSGVEYRTTERYNGKVVYTKLIGFGGLPDANVKSVTAISERVSVVSFSGVAYDGVEMNEFPVIFSTGLAAYAYTSLGASKTEIMVRTLQNLSRYSADFVIKYIKN